MGFAWAKFPGHGHKSYTVLGSHWQGKTGKCAWSRLWMKPALFSLPYSAAAASCAPRRRCHTTDTQPQSQLPSALAVGRCGNPPSQPSRARGHGDKGTGPRQVLKAILTLFQPGGEGIFCPPYTGVPTKLWKLQTCLQPTKSSLVAVVVMRAKNFSSKFAYLLF